MSLPFVVRDPIGAKRLSGGLFSLFGLVLAALWAGTASAAETSGIKALTAEQARQLITDHEGPLDLSGLAMLPADVTAVLAGHDGDLVLDGLTSLSPQAAAALAAHTGSTGAAVDPDAIAARVFEAFEEGDLQSGRFETIIAEFGGEGPLPMLSLGGIADLSPAVAQALARHLGDIRLDGLRTLSVESAAALAHHVGGLSLAGIEALDPDVAEALAPHLGDVFIPDAILEKVTADLQPPPAAPSGSDDMGAEDAVE